MIFAERFRNSSFTYYEDKLIHLPSETVVATVVGCSNMRMFAGISLRFDQKHMMEASTGLPLLTVKVARGTQGADPDRYIRLVSSSHITKLATVIRHATGSLLYHPLLHIIATFCYGEYMLR